MGRRAFLIAGATASGKSAAAMRLARQFDGIIVNADSMQVYGELRILTARPSEADEAEVPHRLYGHVPVSEAYSVAKWLDDVSRVLAETEAAGKPAVVVGGTGLYFNALTRGLSPIPEIDERVREHWRAEALKVPAETLHGELARLDPLTAAQVRASDRQRVVRALEVLQSTGRPLASWLEETTPPLLAPERWRGVVVAPDREAIYARCDQRFDEMMRMGALEEVARLEAMGLSPELPAMKALGVPALIAHLRGEVPLEEAVEKAKTQTRQYVKRQITWLRRYMMSWTWLDF